MIFTCFGSRVDIASGNLEKGMVRVRYSDYNIKTKRIIDLKADGGIAEIKREVNKSNAHIDYLNKHLRS